MTPGHTCLSDPATNGLNHRLKEDLVKRPSGRGPRTGPCGPPRVSATDQWVITIWSLSSGGHVSRRSDVGLCSVLLLWQRGGRSGGSGHRDGQSAARWGVAQRGVQRPGVGDRLRPLLHQPAQLHGQVHRGRCAAHSRVWHKRATITKRSFTRWSKACVQVISVTPASDARGAGEWNMSEVNDVCCVHQVFSLTSSTTLGSATQSLAYFKQVRRRTSAPHHVAGRMFHENKVFFPFSAQMLLQTNTMSCWWLWSRVTWLSVRLKNLCTL